MGRPSRARSLCRVAEVQADAASVNLRVKNQGHEEKKNAMHGGASRILTTGSTDGAGGIVFLRCSFIRIVEWMAANPRVPIDWVSRKERFRAYMKAFNPNAPALEPIESGFAAADLHDSLFERIAGRAEIEPGSQQ